VSKTGLGDRMTVLTKPFELSDLVKKAVEMLAR
jgi:hypothetical protein